MATATIPASTEHARQESNTARSAARARYLAAPALLGACGFVVGILIAHFAWVTAGWLLAALLMLFATTAAACRFTPRITWASAVLLYVALGCLCAEIAPAVNPQRELARLADNTPRFVQGTVTRLGQVRTVAAASPF